MAPFRGHGSGWLDIQTPPACLNVSSNGWPRSSSFDPRVSIGVSGRTGGNTDVFLAIAVFRGAP
jgi:hypothetical protein